MFHRRNAMRRFECLQRMGCVDLQNDLMRVDPLVRLTLAGREQG